MVTFPKIHGRTCASFDPNIFSKTLNVQAWEKISKATNGPLIEYATLREYLEPNVKNILWIYYEGNDINNLENELKSYILIHYLKDLNFTQNLKLKQNEINELALQMIEKEKDNDLAFFPRSNFNLIKKWILIKVVSEMLNTHSFQI